MDIQAFDRRALDGAGRIVARVTTADLSLPTPCTEWDLRALIVHMAGNNNGWADAAEGKPPDAAVWTGAGLAGDLVSEYRKSADRVAAAFAGDGVLDRAFEVYGFGSFSAPTAIGMHFIDYLSHGWDVAVTIGAEPFLDPELCAAVLRIGERWPPDAASIWGPGAPFGYRVAMPGDAPPDQRMLGFLGRSPSWPGPAGPDSR
jgi:uncharacterized protein (TIGR03086 family)